jgi:ribosomal protein L37AE/L43A
MSEQHEKTYECSRCKQQKIIIFHTGSDHLCEACAMSWAGRTPPPQEAER